MYHAASTKIYETVDIPTSYEDVRRIINPINGSTNLFSCVVAMQVINVLSLMVLGQHLAKGIEQLGYHQSGRAAHGIKLAMLRHCLITKKSNKWILNSAGVTFYNTWLTSMREYLIGLPTAA